MTSLKTRLATLTLAALGAGAAAAQTVLVVPMEPVVAPQPTVVVVPDTSANAMGGATHVEPDTRTMGAAPAMTNRHGDPLASTAQASTTARPDLFRSADGTHAALGGGTYLERSAPMMTLPPAMHESGRIDRGNAQ